jgi:mRNA-degrading endonuclease RelE of RelBE toxin-antitoxin system
VFESIFTTGVMLMMSSTTFFYQAPDLDIDSPVTLLATVDIVAEPGAKTTKETTTKTIKKKTKKITKKTTKEIPKKLTKKITKTQKPRQVSTRDKKTSKIKSASRTGKIKISGYRGQSFVYGEVISMKDGKLQGFIYHPDNSKTYVYGERVDNKINLYDVGGNLYQMADVGSLNQEKSVKHGFIGKDIGFKIKRSK